MRLSARVAPVVWFLALAAGCNPPAATEEPAPEAVEIPTVGSMAEQPQLFLSAGGELLLSWTARGEAGIDLFMARSEDGEFRSATRINAVPGSINRITIDEMRAALAPGPDNRLAVAWTDADYDIRLAVSEDGGATFGEPVRLNQDNGDALQEFPAIAFDETGVLHAVWLDPRFAGAPVEEPADLYYARIEDGVVTERNLTADQTATVCGCCLPDLRIDGEAILVTFRNTTDDGYRDPFQVHGTVSGDFGPPTAVTAPVWRIEACPVSGPIAFGGNVLWIDGSTGIRRLLESRGPGNEPRVLLEDTGEWFLDYPPRRVRGAGAESLLLVPAAPAYVLRRDGGDWNVVIDDLPAWATTAAVHDGELIVAGSSNGRFALLRRPLPD